jgi:hypothetical protein
LNETNRDTKQARAVSMITNGTPQYHFIYLSFSLQRTLLSAANRTFWVFDSQTLCHSVS